MKLIRMSIILAILCAIPMCALIYISVDQLQKSAPLIAEFRRLMQEYGGFSGSRYSSESEGEEESGEPYVQPEPELPYPVERTISNTEGTSLDVVILGRSEELLQILVLTDNQHYDYPIEKLARSDRGFVRGLPLHVADPAAYPIPRRLIRHDEKQMMVMIIGRDQFNVFFTFFDQSKIRTYSISRLSRADRDFIFALPLKSRPDSENF